MPWTKEQENAIYARDCSVLVSAAAGSGKTAVLVERILSKVLDEDNPVDVDEFLVVTFTKAAAAQMRDKIAAKIEAELEKQPDNQHLIKQMTLVNRADITTIDSFCLRIVKENFSLLDIDSTINIGDNGMMELIKADVLEELFEEKYKSNKDAGEYVDFYTLVDIFSGDKMDEDLKEQILKVYKVASSYPVPSEWLSLAKKALMVETEEKFNKLHWVNSIIDIVRSRGNEALELVRLAKDICAMPAGPDKNYDMICEEEAAIEAITKVASYSDVKQATNISWGRLKPCKGDSYDQDLYKELKELRDNYKELVKKSNLFNGELDDIVLELKSIGKYLIPFIELVEEFSDRYMKTKLAKKLLEFSDIEHYAYSLVCAGYDSDGKAIPTEVGRKIAERYKEIYIDEYQDSNFLQEHILTSVSGYYRDEPNMFMVGDVKQSIYRFRMARPDLFLSKYESFLDKGKEIKIELKNNFRSRAVVLNTTNFFCYQLMGADLGGIEYNQDIALVPTKEYPEPEAFVADKISTTTDILLIDGNLEDEDSANISDEEKDVAKFNLEAKVVASKIKELTNEETGQYVLDEETGEYRLAQYRDIVILARSIKGFGEVFYNELMAADIPVYLEDTKGYFDATEVKTVMELLLVIDNSRQDIPMAAVLLSPMGSLTENELAIVCDYNVKHGNKKLSLYDKCLYFIEKREDALSQKLKRIIDIILSLKESKKSLNISELIWRALDMTGYYYYVAAMPQGEKRKANLNILLEKARTYEDGYYKGLFNFLRYIEKIKVNDGDFGEANILSDDENVVRIISMHKSKGLEYPIVFVSGLGKRFNIKDSNNMMVIHSDSYLAAPMVDKEARYMKDGCVKECFKEVIRLDGRAEELRVLYVALTRAKEKLILTACDKGITSYMSGLNIATLEGNLIPYSLRSATISSFIKLILGAMVRYDELKEKFEVDGLINIYNYSYEDALACKLVTDVKHKTDVESLRVMAETKAWDEVCEAVKSNFDFTYAYASNIEMNSKMSISDIKKMKAYDGEKYDIAENVFSDKESDYEEQTTSVIRLSGAERGTIVHKFMELLDFANYNMVGDSSDQTIIEKLNEFKFRLAEDKLLSEEELEAINIWKIKNMLSSNLGSRMIKADTLGRLKKEQQFSAGIKVSDIYEDIADGAGEDVVVVQGIIDAFFYEEDEIVVMDYKTDRASEEELILRYKAQLDYYSDILERLTGKRVKEKIIYSFYNDNEIQL